MTPVTERGVSTLLDIEQIRQLIDMMVANDLVEVSIRDGEQEINLRRPTVTSQPVIAAPMQLAAPSAPLVAPATIQQTAESRTAAEPSAEAALVEIGSPMVGTYYASPDPDSPPFVQVGSHVHPGTVVCILEAMKVFNEIKAEVSGTIERVLVKSGQAVEYGQPLFMVRAH
jgi:acetyl-CoA carboxylase biotin carboxyl carrier protein